MIVKVLLYLGARFTPCIHPTAVFPNGSVRVVCPDGTSSSLSTTTITTSGTTVQLCTLSDICHSPQGQTPNQWWRLIVPIFLHAGLIHLIANLLFQIRTGFELEKEGGSWRVGSVYMIAGIYGFLLGGNFAGPSGGVVSVGCSGALFGRVFFLSRFCFILKFSFSWSMFVRMTLELTLFFFSIVPSITGLLAWLLIDIIAHYSLIVNPLRELVKLILLIVISLLFGLLPFIDNFSHVGGFLSGIFASLLLMPTFGDWIRLKRMIARGIGFIGLLILFVVTGVQFAKGGGGCEACQYLNCLPVSGGWGCDAKIGSVTTQ